jgi:hypothetical protein
MEDWSKDFFITFELLADEVQQFFLDVKRDIDDAIDGFTKLSEEIVDQVQGTIFSEFDQQLDELTGSLLELYFGLENSDFEAIEPAFYNVEPIVNQHPACAGCSHYHGQVYGSNPLVCGMHPYGVETEKCSDWESF